MVVESLLRSLPRLTAMDAPPRRSTGFTIESLIGADSSDSSAKRPAAAQANSAAAVTPAPGRAAEKPGTEDKDRFSDYHQPPPGLHYPLKCVQNSESLYRNTSGGFTPVRLCGHPLTAAGTSTWATGLPPTPTAIGPAVNLGLYRDHTLFNPWVLARYGGYLGPRYPVGHDGAFILPPYRKPKRIRTAFSPSQLLQLEQAFEKNHYVVGQERKELAVELKLTETQVKVWFQNRRTKHKRMKAEEGATATGPTSREEPSSSSKRSARDSDLQHACVTHYDGSDENSDSEPSRTT